MRKTEIGGVAKKVVKGLMIFVAVAFLGSFVSNDVMAGNCAKGQIDTALFGCVKNDKEGGPIFGLLNVVVVVLTFGVGALAVGGLIFSGIQYASARDNEAQVKAAKQRISNIILGLIVYAFMALMIKWLMPHK